MASQSQPTVLAKYPVNAVIRTSTRYDNIVKHLGYEPVSVSEEERFQFAGLIPTDIALVEESQRRLSGVKVIPEETLTQSQTASLQLARGMIKEYLHTSVPPLVHSAEIPAASDRVRTAGVYARSAQAIYISREQLNRGRDTVDTTIHELAHHTSGAEDGEEMHKTEMAGIAARVVEDVAKGTFDKLLKDVSW